MSKLFKKSIRPLSLALVMAIGMSTAVPWASADNEVLTKDRKVEAFSVPTFTDQQNSKGIFEETGYKTVNSILEFSNTVNVQYVDLKQIEDYYNLNGEYIETKVTSSHSENDLTSGEAKTNTSNMVLHTPTTVLVDAKKDAYIADVNNINEDKIEKNVLDYASKLDKGETKIGPGYTREDITRIKDSVNELKENYNLEINSAAPEGQKIVITPKSSGTCNSTTTCNGAFDNYWNYDSSTGNFKIQALSAEGHKYHGLTGNTIGNTKNASGLTTFQNYINLNFESA